jgi:hypothetical protein
MGGKSKGVAFYKSLPGKQEAQPLYTPVFYSPKECPITLFGKVNSRAPTLKSLELGQTTFPKTSYSFIPLSNKTVDEKLKY